jgi:hypothetical protein
MILLTRHAQTWRPPNDNQPLAAALGARSRPSPISAAGDPENHRACQPFALVFQYFDTKKGTKGRRVVSRRRQSSQETLSSGGTAVHAKTDSPQWPSAALPERTLLTEQCAENARFRNAFPNN